MKLTFYFVPKTSSMAPHIALHECGASFESRPLSFETKSNRESEYLSINPEGKVPTLVVDGRPLTEVAGILYFLAKQFPEAKLLPTDLETQSQIISWMSFCASTIHPARRQGLDHAKMAFGIANDRLGSKQWIAGDYSIADIHLFRLYWRFFNNEHPEPGTYPHLDAHYARMMKRPAVIRTLEIEAGLV